MLKLIGALMVVGATTSLGLQRLEGLNSRLRALEAFISALDTIRADIRYRQTPVPELLEYLGKTSASPAAEFFHRCRQLSGDLTQVELGEIWSRELEALGPLKREELEALKEAGQLLGHWDADGQQAGLDRALERLKRCLAEARENRAAEAKMCVTLGLASGLAAVIILI